MNDRGAAAAPRVIKLAPALASIAGRAARSPFHPRRHQMKLPLLLVAPLLAWTAVSSAAPPKINLVDHSNGLLIGEADAKSVVAANIPPAVWRIYPASRFAIASQVEGGMTADNTCVVAARVMVLPVTPTARAVLFRPQKTATAFGAAPNSSSEQCRAMARVKLKDATASVVSAIVKR